MSSQAHEPKPLPAPRLASLRLPADPWPHAMATNAFQAWRLSARGQPLDASHGASPGEEFKSVCEFMRLYATLRFYQLALLLGTTGSIVTALSSHAVQANVARAEFLKAGGLVVSLAFLVMEFRASSYWHRLRDRGNALARQLSYECFPASSRWNPLTTTGAGFYLHALVTTLWCASLFLRPQPGA